MVIVKLRISAGISLHFLTVPLQRNSWNSKCIYNAKAIQSTTVFQGQDVIKGSKVHVDAHFKALLSYLLLPFTFLKSFD